MITVNSSIISTMGTSGRVRHTISITRFTGLRRRRRKDSSLIGRLMLVSLVELTKASTAFLRSWRRILGDALYPLKGSVRHSEKHQVKRLPIPSGKI